MITSETQKRRKKEKLIQKRIAEDSTLIGLHDVKLKAVEKIQINGRLDLQFKGTKADTRYEVELQLGKLDNDHVMRCVHYWNHERQKHPQYKHYAMIIAEKIPDHILETIKLFNVSITVAEIHIDETNNIIDHNIIYENVIEDEDLCVTNGNNKDDNDKPYYDMDYLKSAWSEKSLAALYKICKLTREVNKETGRNITKKYVGFTADDFYSFMFVESKEDSLIVKLVLDQSPETESIIREVGLKFEYVPHKNKPWYYKIPMNEEDINEKKKEIKELVEMAYEKLVNNNQCA